MSTATRSSAGSSFASRAAFGSTGPSSQTFDQERALSAALKGAYDDIIMQYAGHGGVLQQPQPQAQHHYPQTHNPTVDSIRSASMIGVAKEAPRIMPTLLQLTSQGIPGTVITAPIVPSSSSRKHAPATTTAMTTTSTLSMQSSSASTSSSATVLPAVLQKPKRSRYALGDFSFHRTLGTGSFGRVHLVQSIHNKRHYAVKVLLKEKVVRLKQVEHTNNEREMLTRARHPFLVNLWGTFQDSLNLYMVMDFVAGGELFSLLRKSGRFPNPVAKFYAAEVSMAIDYLHSINIIYRDLKPENILIAADGHIKVTDFGFAKYVPDLTYTLCGTPDYLAPEVIQQKGYNKSVDWYSVGILIFEMLAGYPPFYIEPSAQQGAGSHVQLYEKIIAGVVHYPPFFDHLAVDIIKNCLTTDLSKRYGNMKYGSKDIFGHQWFAEVGWEKIYKKEIPPPFVPRIEGEGDSSQFDRYPEADLSTYGSTGFDPYSHLFAEWS
ncbi:camp-dependent protein kinase catalytic subunit [Tulasnella sp. 424]|nr:camp-dependent protein kinase catalytic subunit [Tulasnella sp. 424]KAG8964300.1 camp-dependent protein kinase catalytic subunit [Tulasnella sp. 425]